MLTARPLPLLPERRRAGVLASAHTRACCSLPAVQESWEEPLPKPLGHLALPTKASPCKSGQTLQSQESQATRPQTAAFKERSALETLWALTDTKGTAHGKGSKRQMCQSARGPYISHTEFGVKHREEGPPPPQEQKICGYKGDCASSRSPGTLPGYGGSFSTGTPPLPARHSHAQTPEPKRLLHLDWR